MPACLSSLRQLACRPNVARDTLLRLAAADAFRSLGLSRREAVWQILALDQEDTSGKAKGREPGLRVQDSLFAEMELPESSPPLPPESPDEVVVEDYDAIGMCLTAHPIGLLRAELEAIRTPRGSEGRHGTRLASADARTPLMTPPASFPSLPRGVLTERILPNDVLKTARPGQRVAVAGMVTCRQHPSTARGTVFITLEDETASANLIIRPRVWEQNRNVGRSSLALVAEGVVERQGAVVHVMATRLHDLSALLGRMRDLRHGSRDFH